MRIPVLLLACLLLLPASLSLSADPGGEDDGEEAPGVIAPRGGTVLSGVGAGQSEDDADAVPVKDETKQEPGSGSLAPAQAPVEPGNPDIFYWKLQPNGNPNHCEGKPRVITRWPTSLHTTHGAGRGNSYVVADGVRMDFYALDGGGGGAKPSYAVCDKFGTDFKPNTVVFLFKDGKPYANITVPDPTVGWKVSGSRVRVFAQLYQPQR